MSKESFLRLFSNLPINIRRDIILVLDKEGPISWEVAYLEISNDTKLGEIILKKLSEMKVI